MKFLVLFRWLGAYVGDFGHAGFAFGPRESGQEMAAPNEPDTSMHRASEGPSKSVDRSTAVKRENHTRRRGAFS